MKVVKGADITFTPNKLFDAMFEALLDVGVIASRRLEEEAKQFLNERMIGEKSSGTLEEGIQGFVDIKFGGVQVGVRASALELGQWEASVGETEEADYTRQSPPFDYAGVVEGGSGVFGPSGSPITASSGKGLRFWTGGYKDTSGGSRKKIMRTRAVAGQPGKNFLEDALVVSMPAIGQLLSKIGTKIRATDIARWS